MSTPENPYANPVSTAPQLNPAEEKQWAILTHVLGIFFGAISAAVFYFLYRDRGPFVRAHTATEWNFQLTLLIVSAFAFVLSFSSIFVSMGSVSSGATSSSPPASFALFFVGYFLLIAVRLMGAIFGIVAAVAANKGQYYRYPLAIRFAK